MQICPDHWQAMQDAAGCHPEDGAPTYLLARDMFNARHATAPDDALGQKVAHACGLAFEKLGMGAMRPSACPVCDLVAAGEATAEDLVG